MKKQILKSILLLAIPMVLTTSCSKDDEKKEAAAPSLGTATIKGRLTGDIVLNSGKADGIKGVKITGRINTSDLVAVGSVNTAGLIRTYEATTDDDGFYTLTVEAGSRPVGVTLDIPATIITEQTLENGNKENRTFNRVTAIPAITVVRGQVLVQDANYNFAAPVAKGLVTLEATVSFRNDLCKGISADLDSQITTVPVNTTLRVSWADDNLNPREVDVKTDANGKFTLSVETANANKTLTVRGIKFFADRKRDINSDGTCDTENNHGYTTGNIIFTINRGETNKEKITFN